MTIIQSIDFIPQSNKKNTILTPQSKLTKGIFFIFTSLLFKRNVLLQVKILKQSIKAFMFKTFLC